MINIVKLSHNVLKEVNNPNKAIDMTCGRGNDTLFLANIAKEVYAFDIQDEAIESTTKLLKDNGVKNVLVKKESHDLFDIYVSGEIDLIIYNLGYLPQGDKTIKTNASTVKASLMKAIDYLSVGGIIVLVVYLHDDLESKAITDFTRNLGKDFDVLKYEVLNKEKSPYIIKIVKNS